MLHCAQGIGQFLGSRAGAQGLLLVFGRGPAGKTDKFKRGGDAAIRLRMKLRIQPGGPRQHRAPGRVAQAGGQGIAFAHRAQILHQVHGIAVGDGAGKTVSHRQGKTGALQQGTQIANLAHRQDTRR